MRCFIICLAFLNAFCVTGCCEHRVLIGDSSDKGAKIIKKDLPKHHWTLNDIIDYMLIYNDGYERAIPYGCPEMKIECFKNIEDIKGEAIQQLRFFCWLCEDYPEVREMFIRQWLGQMRYEHKLPPLDEIKERICPLLSFCDSLDVRWSHLNENQKQKRIQEIERVYSSLGDTSHLFFHDESEYRLLVLQKKWLKPFLNSRCPMGSVLFCGDKNKIRQVVNRFCRDNGEILKEHHYALYINVVNIMLEDPIVINREKH